jgi:hypothetical protein
MSNIKANVDLLKHITQGVAAVASATRKMASSIDALHAGGMRSTDFISPKSKDGASTSSPEQFEAINVAIVAGFTAAVQKLMAAPTKGVVGCRQGRKAVLAAAGRRAAQ